MELAAFPLFVAQENDMKPTQETRPTIDYDKMARDVKGFV